MTFNEFNNLDKKPAAQELYLCCGSTSWTRKVMNHFPFSSLTSFIDIATNCWYEKSTKQDWLEAFLQHPKIGESKFSGKKKETDSSQALAEQAGVRGASVEIIKSLASANKAYQNKFGFIFIVCATGKSAYQLLRLLNDRLPNNREEELIIAMGEQHKITMLRFQKLFTDAAWQSLKVSQLTTHVLNTSTGKPAADLSIKLKSKTTSNWHTISQGITNDEGRISDFLPPGKTLKRGDYKLVFETEFYFKNHKIKGFYPCIEIQFTVFDDQHYHVPLLLNPFGYSTYRGS